VKSDPLYVELRRLETRTEQESAFEGAWRRLTHGGSYDLDEPRHAFLRWLVATKPVLLHGSNRMDLEVFKPRNQTDYAGVPVRAVFATSDGVWPIYFAIADRRVVRSLINDCVHEGGIARYFFSVATVPEDAAPWTRGTVYVLPRPPFRVSHGSTEWLSRTQIIPLARLPVEPIDFPFLDVVHRHAPDESETALHARLRTEPRDAQHDNAA
jgi:hypothetical protein